MVKNFIVEDKNNNGEVIYLLLAHNDSNKYQFVNLKTGAIDANVFETQEKAIFTLKSHYSLLLEDGIATTYVP